MSAPPADTRHRARARRFRDAGTFALLAGPNLILLGLFTFRPMLFSLWVSLTSWRLPGRARDFIGFENYTRLSQDAEFGRVLFNTVVYALAVVIIAQTLAFVLALALNGQRRGAAMFRFLAFTPHVTLTVAAAVAWLLVLDSERGPAAIFYGALGIEGPDWLGDSRLALPALIVLGAWKEIGFATLFFLAGLQSLPEAPFESARLEGAGRLQILRRLTLPMMAPVILFMTVSGLIAAAKTFDAVAVMTQGGPVYPDSGLLVYHLYRTGFRDYEIGYASAMANAFWMALLIFAVVQLRGARRWVSYDS